MKWLWSIIFLGFFQNSFAQYKSASFDSIDDYVQNLSAPTPDSLAHKLTAPFHTDLEKVRAIFSWITRNISYNTGIFSSIRNYSPRYNFDPLDTMTVWKPADEMVAIRVLHRRVTICEGYSRLFKVLCDYAGLKAEVIVGYANGNPYRRSKFRCNHSWNAVMIDSTWRLLDVTWASGYIDHRNEFVQKTDERFFLPSPADFIRDHYPADLRWALLQDIPPVREFELSPFMYKSFDKYSLTSFPRKGIIEAALGDTIQLGLTAKDIIRDRSISSDPFFDSTILATSPYSAFIEPVYRNNQVLYTYIIRDPSVQWIHLLYNEDLVLRYKLKIR
jgi:hypothetical protein